MTYYVEKAFDKSWLDNKSEHINSYPEIKPPAGENFCQSPYPIPKTYKTCSRQNGHPGPHALTGQVGKLLICLWYGHSGQL